MCYLQRFCCCLLISFLFIKKKQLNNRIYFGELIHNNAIMYLVINEYIFNATYFLLGNINISVISIYQIKNIQIYNFLKLK